MLVGMAHSLQAFSACKGRVDEQYERAGSREGWTSSMSMQAAGKGG